MTSKNGSKPTALRVLPDNIPAELKRWPQWVVWRYEWSDKKNDWDKPPRNARTGAFAKSTDRRTWSSFEDAWTTYGNGGWDGIGFCPSEETPFAFGDFDHYVADGTVDQDLVDGVLRPLETYVELSPSGTGVRVIAEAKLPGKGRKNSAKRAELYDQGHYLTITGQGLPMAPAEIAERQERIEELYALLAPSKKVSDQANTSGVTGEDDDLLRDLRKSKQRAKFKKLFDAGDTSDYGSPSEADNALCCILAFWTRKDAGQMDRLFRQSKLMRPKWDESHGEQTYGQMTIAHAIEFTPRVLGGDPDNEPFRLQCEDSDPPMYRMHWPKGIVRIPNGDLYNFERVRSAHTAELKAGPNWGAGMSRGEWEQHVDSLLEEMEQDPEGHLPVPSERTYRGRVALLLKEMANSHYIRIDVDQEEFGFPFHELVKHNSEDTHNQRGIDKERMLRHQLHRGVEQLEGRVATTRGELSWVPLKALDLPDHDVAE